MRQRMMIGILMLAAIAACAGSRSAGRVRADGTIAALLADGRILLVSPDTAEPVRELWLDSAALSEAGGQLLRQSADGKYLVAALPRRNSSVTTLAVVNLNSGAIESRQLREAGTIYSSVVLGPRTGLAHLIGAEEGHVVASSYEIPGLSRTMRRTGTPWQWVSTGLSTAMDAAESRLYVSSRAGGHWFELEDHALRVCPAPTEGASCMRAWAGVHPVGNALVLGTGGAHARLATLDGQVTDSIPFFLSSNEFVSLAIDSAHHRIVAIGSCFAGGGGLATAALTRRAHPVDLILASRAEPSRICGSRIALDAAGRTAVIIRNPWPKRPDSGPGELTVVDIETRSIVRTIPVPAPPVDVIILRR